MNKTQFISFMETPDKISGGDSLLLSELVKNFPYFQTAHLLYTKGLHNQNSIHYNNQLKITAAYATDRKVLHRLITKPQQAEIKAIKIPEIQKEVEQKGIEIPVINTVKEEIKPQYTEPVVEEIVKEIVEEGVQEVVDLLKQFEEINLKFGEEMTDDQMTKLIEEQGRIQELLDTHNAWELDTK